MRLFLNALAALILIICLFPSGGAAAASSIRQDCTGVLDQDGGDYKLRPDIGSGLWCDSGIAGKLVSRVLKACTLGSRCHIKGSVSGHGVFYWLKISLVEALPTYTSVELPRKFFGTWGLSCRRPDLSDGGFEVTATTVKYNYTLCHVVSVGSISSSDTETIVLDCNNGIGRPHEIWHVQTLGNRDFLATARLTREGTQRDSSPNMNIWRRCD